MYKVWPRNFSTQNNEEVETNITTRITVESLGIADSMTDCIKLTFVNVGVTGLNFAKAQWHLDIFFQGVPASILKENRCCIFKFFFSLSFQQRWGKHLGINWCVFEICGPKYCTHSSWQNQFVLFLRDHISAGWQNFNYNWYISVLVRTCVSW